MNHADFYAGSIDRASTGTYVSALLPGGYSNQLLVEPALPYPPAGAARCVVSSFDIYQNSAGNGICVLFFDCTTLPAAGAALFGNSDDTQNVKFIRPITPGGAIFGPVGAPGIRFNYGCGIIVATAATGTVALANENTLITVHYYSYDVAR